MRSFRFIWTVVGVLIAGQLLIVWAVNGPGWAGSPARPQRRDR